MENQSQNKLQYYQQLLTVLFDNQTLEAVINAILKENHLDYEIKDIFGELQCFYEAIGYQYLSRHLNATQFRMRFSKHLLSYPERFAHLFQTLPLDELNETIVLGFDDHTDLIIEIIADFLKVNVLIYKLDLSTFMIHLSTSSTYNPLYPNLAVLHNGEIHCSSESHYYHLKPLRK
jgi:hypothetical protein